MITLHLPRVEDFPVTGDGSVAVWQSLAWQQMPHVAGESTYGTRCKICYSEKGIYFLVDCEDRTLTCTLTEDHVNIFTEDVVEVFLHPSPEMPVYLEYEISPLNYELTILVPQHAGKFHGWMPWHYQGERRVRHATHIRGGPKQSGAKVDGWVCEFFIPFSLMIGLANTPPTRGSSWRANVYRIDYDSGKAAQWAWCPDTGSRFHDYWDFGTFVFG